MLVLNLLTARTVKSPGTSVRISVQLAATISLSKGGRAIALGPLQDRKTSIFKGRPYGMRARLTATFPLNGKRMAFTAAPPARVGILVGT